MVSFARTTCVHLTGKLIRELQLFHGISVYWRCSLEFQTAKTVWYGVYTAPAVSVWPPNCIVDTIGSTVSLPLQL